MRTGRLGDERALKHQAQSRFSTRDEHKATTSGTPRSDQAPGVNTIPHGSRKLVTRSTTTHGSIEQRNSISSGAGHHLSRKQGVKRRMTIGEMNCWIARQEHMKHRGGSSPVTINTEQAKNLKTSTEKEISSLSNKRQQVQKTKGQAGENSKKRAQEPEGTSTKEDVRAQSSDDRTERISWRHVNRAESSGRPANVRMSRPDVFLSPSQHSTQVHNTRGEQLCIP